VVEMKGKKCAVRVLREVVKEVWVCT